jgi:phenylpropionate dioxygenase-like ring-hydroxylating dioxygenase large terminal subunit
MEDPMPTIKLSDPILEHHWHIAALSSEVTDKPVQCFILGEQIVLWRNEQGIHAFKDLCIHRGTALSLGKVCNGNLVCPYHAWEYDSSGRCVNIPAQPPEMTIPTKARTEAYHVQESYSFIWVCLKEPQADIPPYPEFEDSSYHTIICGPYTVPVEPPRVIENFLDVSHLMWVHEGYLGVPSHAQIPEHHVHEVNGQLVSDPIQIYQPDPDGRGKVLNNDYVYAIVAPMAVRFRKSDNRSSEVFSMILIVTPSKVRESKAYMLLSRNYGFEMDDRVFQDFQDKIFSQDLAILESQRPEELPLDLQQELHLKSDRMAIAYRQYLTRLGVKAGTI